MSQRMTILGWAGMVVAVCFSPIYISADESSLTKTEYLKKEIPKKKKGCPCSKKK